MFQYMYINWNNSFTATKEKSCAGKTSIQICHCTTYKKLQNINITTSFNSLYIGVFKKPQIGENCEFSYPTCI